MAKVLIIEDDKTLCHELEHIIADLGHSVRSAETAYVGFNVIKEWHPDVVLCDLNLPDGSGMDIMRLINSCDAEYFKVAFLFISAEPSRDIVTKALNLGADDYLIKPIDPDVLRARIQGLLRKQEKYEPDQTPE
jgi:DNA-binding response OmpR family regulator